MPNGRKRGFARFMFTALKNSMLTGIPQIIAAGNWPKKITRTVVFMFCMAGFIGQSIIFMQMYWEYKTVVDIKVYTPSEVERPSFTICNEDGLNTTKVCESMESAGLGIYCTKLYEGFKDIHNICDCSPRHCRDGVLVKSIWHFRYLYRMRFNFIPYEERRKYNIKFDELIKSCTETRMNSEDVQSQCNLDYYREIPCYDYITTVEVCYTLNTLIDRPNHTIPKVSSEGEINLELDHSELLADFDRSQTRLRIALHNQYRVANPFQEGYILDSNYLYTFRFKKIVKHLLPYPYETDCMDYRPAWKARGGKGPTTMLECIAECELNVTLENYGCVGDLVTYPGNYLRCRTHNYDRHRLTPYFIGCRDLCKPACFEEHYVLERDAVLIQDDTHSCGKENSGRGVTRVKLLLNGMETTVYEYRPKFQVIETFSYLGGYVGMWLGISLLAVFDFLETVIVMIKYPVKRYLRFQFRRKTNVIHIKSYNRNL